MPTQEQLDSRKKLDEFVEAARETLHKVKSKWFGRPDDELKGWIEQGRAIDEIKDSMGYRLILFTLDRQIEWARNQLEAGTANDTEMRGILKGLRFSKDFILTTERNAEIASGVLAGREAAIGRDATVFVKNATVRN